VRISRIFVGVIVTVLVVVILVIGFFVTVGQVIFVTAVLADARISDVVVVVQVQAAEFFIVNFSERNGVKVVSVSCSVSVVLDVHSFYNWSSWTVPVTVWCESQMTFAHVAGSSRIIIHVQLLNITNKNVAIAHHLSAQNSNTIGTHFWEGRSIEENFTNFSAINPKFGLGPAGLFVKTNGPTNLVPFGIVSLQHFRARQLFKLQKSTIRFDAIILVENRMGFTDV
jgi:hypothetical protein